MKFIVPKTADSYSRFMKLAQVIAVIMATLILLFCSFSLYAHVDLCDCADVAEKVREEAEEKAGWFDGWYDLGNGIWCDSPCDNGDRSSGTCKDSPDRDN